MRNLLILMAVAFAGACERGGTSAAEMQKAAIERTRQELGLAPGAPLQAEVWVGSQEHQDDIVLCGTVSGASGGPDIAPKRFAATGDPIRWLIFEDAHDPMVTAQPDKFPEWQRLCAGDTNR